MARTVNEEETIAKRNEILDITQRHIYTKGYEQMSIKDIRSELGMSNGAFYHYFDSKPAVLDALIERIQQETEKPLRPILNNPHLSAVEKLQGFFDTLDNLRLANRAEVIQLARIWYTEANTMVRQKVDEAVRQQRAPLLTEVVLQGVAEGSFTAAYPEQTGEIIISLLQGMGNSHAKLLFLMEQPQNETLHAERIVAIHAAYMDAIERVLGAPPNSLYRAGVEQVLEWIFAVKADSQSEQTLNYASNIEPKS